MNLQAARAEYDAKDETQTRNEIARVDKQNMKRNQDIDMGAARLILRAPNGNRYCLVVSNAGVLSTVLL